ncbi:hypothetical protein CLV51_107252 [Chitinophaga niastensis]|uniref:Uncharacterized protein n=1 Tax=Chitinophaga niastensis TaxID=536980 RepID=A0A2P8HCH7_CHINA|nr:hypothetical protein CLV51_107252 [Chitinophaga niastensis]
MLPFHFMEMYFTAYSSHLLLVLFLCKLLDKKLLKRIEYIEALPEEEKEKIYYFIDMAITYNKTKKAYSRYSVKSQESGFLQ